MYDIKYTREFVNELKLQIGFDAEEEIINNLNLEIEDVVRKDKIRNRILKLDKIREVITKENINK